MINSDSVYAMASVDVNTNIWQVLANCLMAILYVLCSADKGWQVAKKVELERVTVAFSLAKQATNPNLSYGNS